LTHEVEAITYVEFPAGEEDNKTFGATGANNILRD
jgi:hypothetical protein